MIYTFIRYFLLFYVYSVVGYICEVLSIYRVKKKIVWNRGYLLGPYLPVFGFGSLIVSLFLKEYQNNYITLFVLGMVYCATLEYFTSYLLEKIYHVRWWDYSHMKYNVNGRISLETSILFGVGSVVITNFLNPLLWSIMNSIPKNMLISMGFVIFLIMLFDFIVSTKEIIHLRNDMIKINKKDGTEEIKKKMIESIQKHIYYYEHMFNAFPNVKKASDNARKIADIIQKKKG